MNLVSQHVKADDSHLDDMDDDDENIADMPLNLVATSLAEEAR